MGTIPGHVQDISNKGGGLDLHRKTGSDKVINSVGPVLMVLSFISVANDAKQSSEFELILS